MRLLPVLLACSVVLSQESKKEISLPEIVDKTVETYPGIKASRMRPLISDAEVMRVYGQFVPTVFGEAKDSLQSLQSTSFLEGATAGSVTTLDSRQASLTAGLKQTFEWGLGYQVSLSTVRTDTQSAFALVNPSVKNSAGVSLTMPLLKDWDPGRAITVAQITKQADLEKTRADISTIIFQLESAYWNAVYSIASHKISNETLKLSKQLHKENEERNKQGVISGLELSYSLADVLTNEDNLLQAQLQLRVARKQLQNFVDGISLDGYELQSFPEDVAAISGDKLPALLQEAIELNMDIKTLKKQLESKAKEIEIARTQTRPKLNASLSGSYNGTDRSFSGANDFLNDGTFYDLSGGLTLEIPLDNSLARASLRRAEVESEIIRSQIRQKEIEVTVKVGNAIEAVDNAFERISTLKKLVAENEKKYKAEQERQRVGTTTTYYVNQASVEWLKAKVLLQKSYRDYFTSRAELDTLSGRILEKWNISVQ